jgi:hypothetical protein
MMAGLYMGPSSAFAGAFGGNPPLWGGKPIMGNGGQPISGGPAMPGPPQNGSNPANPTPPATSAPNAPQAANVLAPQAVRATGPSQGYDSSYLQNLATAIGGLFSNPQGGNVMNVNPLGNLAEISPPSGQLGNAPQPGLPQTWIQQALAGLGFGYTPPPPNQSIVNRPPQIGSLNGGGGAGLRTYQ